MASWVEINDKGTATSGAGIYANGASGSFNYRGPQVTANTGSAQRSAAFWQSRDSGAWGMDPINDTDDKGGHDLLEAAAIGAALLAALWFLKRKR